MGHLTRRRLILLSGGTSSAETLAKLLAKMNSSDQRYVNKIVHFRPSDMTLANKQAQKQWHERVIQAKVKYSGWAPSMKI
jgi:uncharacterized protein YtpQ (UPF0354 family)